MEMRESNMNGFQWEFERKIEKIGLELESFFFSEVQRKLKKKKIFGFSAFFSVKMRCFSMIFDWNFSHSRDFQLKFWFFLQFFIYDHWFQ